MTLSVIIVNWNTQEDLRTCILSVQKHIGNIWHEMIVIDNNSQDESYETVLQYFSQIKIYKNKKNIGFARAVNQGIKVSRGDNILILNPDVIIKNNAIQIMLNSLKQDKKIGAVGPKIINNKNRKEYLYVRFPTFMQILLFHTVLKILTLKNTCLCDQFLYLNNDEGNNIRDVELVPGACLLIKKAAIRDIGLMDSQFQLWFEDTDYCIRLKKKGWRLICDEKAKVIHAGAASTRKLPVYNYLSIFYTSMFKYFLKHKGYLYSLSTILVMILNMFLTSIMYALLAIISTKRKRIYLSSSQFRFRLGLSWIGLIFGKNYESTLS